MKRVHEDAKKTNKKTGVFITGATGFVGSNMLLKLLLEDQYKLFCLVRVDNNDPQKRLTDSVLKAAESAGISADAVAGKLGNLVAISGDITNNLLGVSEKNIQLIKNSGISHAWHLAAFIKHDRFYQEEIMLTNVEGTRNVVEFAKKVNITEFNYVSTAHVAGKRTGIINEEVYDPAFETNNCYEDSKRKAEDIVIAAGNEGHFYVRIFRPSIILGHSRTYKAISNSEFNAFLGALERFIEWITDKMPDYYKENSFNIAGDKEAMINLIPVDIFADHAIAMSKLKQVSPEICHVVSPHAVSTNDFFSALKKSFYSINFQYTTDVAALNEADLSFQSKVAIINTPFITNKQFIRTTASNSNSRDEILTEAHLCNYMQKYLEEYRLYRKELKAAESKALPSAVKKTITCRYGNPLDYYKTGDGPAIVLFNAYGATMDASKSLISVLSKKYAVITWDYRGFRKSDYPNDDFIWGVREHADDLNEILENENIEQCIIISYCAGATASVVFADTYPSKVKALGYFSGLFMVPSCFYEMVGTTDMGERMRYVIETLLEHPEQASEFVQIIAALLDNEMVPETLKEKLEMQALKNGHAIMGRLLDEEYFVYFASLQSELVSQDIEEAMEKIAVPVLLIVGLHDNIITPSFEEKIAKKIPGARLYRLPAAGHNLQMENMEDWIEILNRFLKSVS